MGRGVVLIDLVLSFDYELFGNGSGDVRGDMIGPAERLLTICDRYGAKVSFMLEVGEYWAMKRAEQEGSLRLDYSPSREIEQQVRDAVQHGHDVQLHLHPDDAALVRESLSPSEGELAWTIVEDPLISRGGCNVTTENSRIDATNESRLQAAIAAIAGDERN